MRDRERRLGRSLQGIVLSLLAAPLGVAAACHSDGVTGEADASAGDASPPDPDSGVVIRDASLPVDAGSPDAAATVDATAAIDAAACAPIPILDASFEDAPDGCAVFRYLPCGLPRDASVQSCLVDLLSAVPLCAPTNFLTAQLLNCDEAGVHEDAPYILDCAACTIAGRRPLGLCAPRLSKRTSTTKTGEYFAEMAHLESASVRAFRDLERWLAELGAPPRLTRAARRAAEDEQRHARAASRLARRFGGVPPRPRVRSVATPSLLALLEDDAIEGCVGETFGALLATFQAESSTDPRVRRTLRRIAEDETRHAALSWEVLAWGAKRLPVSERHRVQRTLAGALDAMARRPASRLDEATRTTTGHPTPQQHRRLVDALAGLVRAETKRDVVMRRRPAPKKRVT